MNIRAKSGIEIGTTDVTSLVIKTEVQETGETCSMNRREKTA